ncbi:MAG: hybrid sensor histidine kinase/response regulator [Gemmatimonadota bacterium]|nr:hybrid sensor histidine kinase/response regulator [Gemmatimonadota bacterium]MDH5761007.1 hybrid sensor histidine kinase/response regulator [Gemmatimonadota bacterium]
MATTNSLQGRRVLTIDDSPMTRTLLTGLLSAHGAEVVCASDGAEGLATLLHGGPFDVALLDLVLPDMHGLDVLRRVREEDQDTPIVVLTGKAGINTATDALGKGADGYVDKAHLNQGNNVLAFMDVLAHAMDRRSGISAQRELEEVKRRFYSMITHDLRGPAGVIKMLMELLLSEEGLPPKHRSLLMSARDTAEKMAILVTEFLDFSMIDAGVMDPDREDVDLREIVRSSADGHRLAAEVKGQTLTTDLPSTVVMAAVDGQLVTRVIDNLLSNAVKYTPRGGRLRVRVEVDGDHGVITVADNGKGIPCDELEHLFDPYRRAKGAKTVEGTGLGLAIVRQIVDAHGGSVHAESPGGEEHGARFVVRLPLVGSLHDEATPTRVS